MVNVCVMIYMLSVRCNLEYHSEIGANFAVNAGVASLVLPPFRPLEDHRHFSREENDMIALQVDTALSIFKLIGDTAHRRL